MPRSNATPVHVKSISDEDHLDTLAKGIAVLRLFGADMKSLSIQETADILQISRSAARRILLTLEHLGYMAQVDRRYVLTSRVLDFGFSYLLSSPLPDIARPILRELSAGLNEAVSLAILEGGDAVFIERVQPHQAFRIDFDVGSRLPAYSFSVGQVLLSGLNEADLDHYLKVTPLLPVTPLTVTDAEVLRATICKIRQDGYRLGLNDMIYGVGGIAVPIRNHHGDTIAAMVVPMFHGRDLNDMVGRYLPAMQAAAETIGGFVVRRRGQ